MIRSLPAPLRDLGLRFCCAVLATFLLAPVAGAILDTIPFHRVVTRTFLVSLLVAFLVRRGPPRTWPAKLAAMGLEGPDRTKRFATGAAVAIALLAGLLWLSWATGGRATVGSYRYSMGAHLLKALVAGVAVAFVEEILVRGYLKDVLGGPFSAAIFAAAHFFRPSVTSDPAPGGYDPLLVFRRFGDLLEGWTEPRSVTLGIVGLFLFALALNRLRERTGTLYAGIGIHAGLVFALQFYRRFLAGLPTGDPWIHGGPRVHDGVLGTTALALLLVAAWVVPLPRSLRRRAGPR